MRGRIEEIDENQVIVDVGAFGIIVAMPVSQIAQMHEGQTVALYTHLHVREQDISLFGFTTEEELQLFQLLLGVDGVGPRLALNILSTLPPDTLRLAVANEEPGILTRVPGIGAKSARKILFHLKDKLAPTDLGAAGIHAMSDDDADVIEALTSLGYSVVEAQRAVQALPKDVKGVEERLVLALAQLAP
ncbi:MAG: Holliday junction branch migration protein RuvA [Caldilineales bacterium]|nr:Holliday junction branch migration protein RuvA [Caldilineales bacterium]